MSVIKNLFVNGCSFTDDRCGTTWATFLKKKYPNLNYHNIANYGAGNRYICNSTIQFLEDQNFNPEETLVIIMWSGTKRIDLDMSGEWWYHLYENYPHGRNINDQHYYLFSSGIAWTKQSDATKIFNWPYKLSDPHTLCADSLMNFINLENYLKVHGYQYRFSSFVNYWDPQVESSSTGEYSIPYFCNKHSLYQKYKMTNWIFVNDQQDCIAEFSASINEFDHTSHPTVTGHREFTEQILLPSLSDLTFV